MPAEAVQNGQQGQYVYVVKPDSTVAFRAVQVSLRNGDDVVVTTGLKAGEEVVTDGHARSHARARGSRSRTRAPARQARAGPPMNFATLFIKRPVTTTLIMLGDRRVRRDVLPAAAGERSAERRLTRPFRSARACRARARRRWPRRSRRRSRSSSRRSPGITQINSTSTLGSTKITLQFELDRNIDAAAQDVQTAIATDDELLPPSMPAPPSYQKVNPADQPVILPRAAARRRCRSRWSTSTRRTMLAQRISMVSGVAQVQVYGAQKYAVRIDVDPRKLAAHGIGIDEVATRFSNGNVNLPTGTMLRRRQDVHVLRERPAAATPPRTRR